MRNTGFCVIGTILMLALVVSATEIAWKEGDQVKSAPVKAAEAPALSSNAGIAALLVFLGFGGLGSTAAQGETRTISFHHIHAGEDLTVTYKVNGRYDEEA